MNSENTQLDTATPSQTFDEDRYPGVEIDIADQDRVSAALVDERTDTLNNNPRNNDMQGTDMVTANS